MRDLLEKRKRGDEAIKTKSLCKVCFSRLQYKANLSPPSHYFTFDFSYLLKKASWAMEANLNWNKNCNYRVENEPNFIFFFTIYTCETLVGSYDPPLAWYLIEKYTHETPQEPWFRLSINAAISTKSIQFNFNVLFLKSCISIIHRVSLIHTLAQCPKFSQTINTLTIKKCILNYTNNREEKEKSEINLNKFEYFPFQFVNF